MEAVPTTKIEVVRGPFTGAVMAPVAVKLASVAFAANALRPRRDFATVAQRIEQPAQPQNRVRQIYSMPGT